MVLQTHALLILLYIPTTCYCKNVQVELEAQGFRVMKQFTVSVCGANDCWGCYKAEHHLGVISQIISLNIGMHVIYLLRVAVATSNIAELTTVSIRY